MTDDASLDAWVEDTVAPYRGIVPGAALDDMRVLVRAMLASHPAGAQLSGELCHRTPQASSGVIGDEPAVAHDAAANGERR